MEDLKVIIQKMIDAGEPEEKIKEVIRLYKERQSGKTTPSVGSVEAGEVQGTLENGDLVSADGSLEPVKGLHDWLEAETSISGTAVRNAQGNIVEKKTKKYKDIFGSLEEEDVVKVLRDKYPGFIIDETNTFDPASAANPFAFGFNFDAVKITNPNDESKTITIPLDVAHSKMDFQQKLLSENKNELVSFINDNIDALNVDQYDKNYQKRVEDQIKFANDPESGYALSDEQQEQIKEEVENIDLSDPLPVNATRTPRFAGDPLSVRGGGDYTYTPKNVYEDDLKLAEEQLKNRPFTSEKPTREEIEDLARKNIIQERIDDAKIKKKTDWIKKNIDDKPILELGLVELGQEKDKDFKLKARLSKYEEDLNTYNEKVLSSKEKDVIDAFNDVFNNPDLSFSVFPGQETVTLEDGRQISKKQYNDVQRSYEMFDLMNTSINKQREELQAYSEASGDIEVAKDLVRRDYNLLSKSISTIGVGFADIAVDAAYYSSQLYKYASLPGIVRNLSLSKEDRDKQEKSFDKMFLDYHDWSGDVRQGYAPDVQFDEALGLGHKDFDWGNFGVFALQEFSTQVPILATLAATGPAAGMTIIGSSSGGRYILDKDAENQLYGVTEDNEFKTMAIATGFGLAEGVFEGVTQRILKRGFDIVKRQGKQKLVRETLYNYIKNNARQSLVYDPALETFSESATQITQNILDSKPIWENVDHAAFSGLMIGTGMSHLPFYGGAMTAAYYNKNNKLGLETQELIKSHKKLSAEIKKIDNNKNLSKSKRNKLQKQLQSDLKTIQNSINDNVNILTENVYNNISDEAAEKFLKTEVQLEGIRQEASEIIKDVENGSLSRDVGLEKLKNLRVIHDAAVQSLHNFRELKNYGDDFALLDGGVKNKYYNRAEEAIISENAKKGKQLTSEDLSETEIKQRANKLYVEDKIDENYESDLKLAKRFNLDLKQYKTNKGAADYYKKWAKDKGVNEDIINETYESIKNGEVNGVNLASIDGKDIILFSKEAAINNYKTQTRSHEIAHSILASVLGNSKSNPKLYNNIANQIALYLKQTNTTAYKKMFGITKGEVLDLDKGFVEVAKKGEKQPFIEIDGVKYKSEEVITNFIELIGKKQVVVDQEGKPKFSGLLGMMLNDLYKDQTKKSIDFKGDKDVINFVIGLGEKISDGTLKVEEAAKMKEDVTGIKIPEPAKTTKKPEVKERKKESPAVKTKKFKIVKNLPNVGDDKIDTKEDKKAVLQRKIASLDEKIKSAKALLEAETGLFDKSEIDSYLSSLRKERNIGQSTLNELDAAGVRGTADKRREGAKDKATEIKRRSKEGSKAKKVNTLDEWVDQLTSKNKQLAYKALLKENGGVVDDDGNVYTIVKVNPNLITDRRVKILKNGKNTDEFPNTFPGPHAAVTRFDSKFELGIFSDDTYVVTQVDKETGKKKQVIKKGQVDTSLTTIEDLIVDESGRYDSSFVNKIRSVNLPKLEYQNLSIDQKQAKIDELTVVLKQVNEAINAYKKKKDKNERETEELRRLSEFKKGLSNNLKYLKSNELAKILALKESQKNAAKNLSEDAKLIGNIKDQLSNLIYYPDAAKEASLNKQLSALKKKNPKAFREYNDFKSKYGPKFSRTNTIPTSELTNLELSQLKEVTKSFVKQEKNNLVIKQGILSYLTRDMANLDEDELQVRLNLIDKISPQVSNVKFSKKNKPVKISEKAIEKAWEEERVLQRYKSNKLQEVLTRKLRFDVLPFSLEDIYGNKSKKEEISFIHTGSMIDRVSNTLAEYQYQKIDLGSRDLSLENTFSVLAKDPSLDMDDVPLLSGENYFVLGEVADVEGLLKDLGKQVTDWNVMSDFLITDDGSLTPEGKSLFQKKIDYLKKENYAVEVIKNKSIELQTTEQVPTPKEDVDLFGPTMEIPVEKQYKGDVLLVRGDNFYNDGLVQGFEYNTVFIEPQYTEGEEGFMQKMLDVNNDGSGFFKTTVKRKNAFFDLDEDLLQGKFSKTNKEKIDNLYNLTKGEWSSGGADRAISTLTERKDLYGLLSNALSKINVNVPRQNKDILIADANTEMLNHIRNFNREFATFYDKDYSGEVTLDYKNIILHRFFNKTKKNPNRYMEDPSIYEDKIQKEIDSLDDQEKQLFELILDLELEVFEGESSYGTDVVRFYEEDLNEVQDDIPVDMYLKLKDYAVIENESLSAWINKVLLFKVGNSLIRNTHMFDIDKDVDSLIGVETTALADDINEYSEDMFNENTFSEELKYIRQSDKFNRESLRKQLGINEGFKDEILNDVKSILLKRLPTDEGRVFDFKEEYLTLANKAKKQSEDLTQAENNPSTKQSVIDTKKNNLAKTVNKFKNKLQRKIVLALRDKIREDLFGSDVVFKNIAGEEKQILKTNRRKYSDFIKKNFAVIYDKIPYSTLVKKFSKAEGLEQDVMIQFENRRLGYAESKKEGRVDPSAGYIAYRKYDQEELFEQRGGETVIRKDIVDYFLLPQASNVVDRMMGLADMISTELGFDATVDILRDPDIIDLLRMDEQIANLNQEVVAKALDRDPNIKFSRSTTPTILVKEDVLVLPGEKEIQPKGIDSKPEGLWYATGNGWKSFVSSAYTPKLYRNEYTLELDYSKILVIDTEEKLINFDIKYGGFDYGRGGINWNKVQEDWSGVQIADEDGNDFHVIARKYLRKSIRKNEKINDNVHDWYYGWDVGSGVIWNKDAIIGYEKVAPYYISLKDLKLPNKTTYDKDLIKDIENIKFQFENVDQANLFVSKFQEYIKLTNEAIEYMDYKDYGTSLLELMIGEFEGRVRTIESQVAALEFKDKLKKVFEDLFVSDVNSFVLEDEVMTDYVMALTVASTLDLKRATIINNLKRTVDKRRNQESNKLMDSQAKFSFTTSQKLKWEQFSKGLGEAAIFDVKDNKYAITIENIDNELVESRLADFANVGGFENQGVDVQDLQNYIFNANKNKRGSVSALDAGFSLLRKSEDPLREYEYDNSVTKTGNALPVLSVVVNGIKSKIKDKSSRNYKIITFNGRYEGGRVSLYKLMARELSKDFNFRVFEADIDIDGQKHRTFVLIKDSLLNDSGAVKTLAQPVDTKFSKSNLDAAFNLMIEDKTGIPSEKEYDMLAKGIARKNKKWWKIKLFLPPSAEDFLGLLYPLLSKGELGDAQLDFLNDVLFKPFNRAMIGIFQDRVRLSREFKEIKKQLKDVPKDLRKKALEGITYEDAVRVYAWSKQGIEVEGVSDSTLQDIENLINENPELIAFVDNLIDVNGEDGYYYPGEDWLAGSITRDIYDGINKNKRKRYLKEWQENVDVIFSKKNMLKLEAAYGSDYVAALRNILDRMKTGQNKKGKYGKAAQKITDWMAGATGFTMFLNMRSATLQLISFANFINLSDNNILKVGQSYLNPEQFAKDMKFLLNSDYMVDRRQGLRINVAESDLVDSIRRGGFVGFVNLILKEGFVLTKFGDSAAIAFGGASFYRNRINTYEKQGMSTKEAEAAAYEDFMEKSERSQQSARPDKISAQQAGPFGRFILAFANTPMQYNRIIKRSFQDLINKRGNAKENISRIIYYSFLQNLLFNYLQQGLYAMAFMSEEEEDDKIMNTANGMVDSILRGMGYAGAVVSGLKNFSLKWFEESEKEGFQSRGDAWQELLSVVPPVQAKIRDLSSAGKEIDYNSDLAEAMGWRVNEDILSSPYYKSTVLLTEAATNLPLAKLMLRIENALSINSDYETIQNWGLLLGWNKWNLGIDMKAEKKDLEKKYRVKSSKSSKGGYKKSKSKFKKAF